MPKYPKNYKDVEYFVPGRKRRVAGSTKAVSDFLSIVHEDYPTFTIKQIRELISDRTRYITDPEAIEVLDAYIKAGYGDHVPNWRY
ncbi:hypothetical protein [Evtepia gabavorous]|jgi:hypothetical protein|uniref:hypothetical protein n=1 Tax=Evtepia gabavorous TaxID=2211183 RepID=UPI003A93794F